jgi:hypothetical protein
MILSWLIDRRRTPASCPRQARGDSLRRRLLHVEPLEERMLLSTVYGITPGNVLIRFESDAPNMVTTIGAVGGLGASETIRGIDFRPRTGQLFASTVPTGAAANVVVKTYTINPANGQATFVGQIAAALALAGDVPTGYDFNPTVDRIRYVNTNDENARLNPNNGTLAGNDTDLTPAATTTIIAAAYDRNRDRASASVIPTTLYTIDRNDSQLSVQGSVDGTPTSPNAGVTTDIGALGFTLNQVNDGGFDIVAAGSNPLGQAFASLTDAADNLTRFYTINLSSGAATSIGLIGNGVTEVRSIAVLPDLGGIGVAGADAGGSPHVRVFDALTGAEKFSFFAYGASFRGGVRVASGDVTGDGTPDIITGAGPGGAPHVRVFDGVTGTQLTAALGSFLAYDIDFSGGVFVASGDVNGDGFDDIITGADAGGGPHVRIFSGFNGSELRNFFAYSPTFSGGVRVAAGDTDLDGLDEIITGAGPGGGPHVKVFSGLNNSELFNFFAYGASFTGGVYVAAGDVNGDGRADVITGAGAGGGPHVKVFSGANVAELQNFFAFAPQFTGGVRVATADANGDGRLDIVTAAGPGGGPHVRVFDGVTLAELDSFFAFNSNFNGGVFVGGLRNG